MKITSSMLLNIVLVAFLVTSVFFMNTTANTSDYETQLLEEYDPHLDHDMDGDIDLYDAVYLLKRYGKKGTPVNWTKLQEDIDYLKNKTAELETTIIDLEATLAYLNDTLTQQIEDLETKLAVLNTTKLGEPDYDSGWTALAKLDNPFGHSLDTTDIIVYIVGKKTWGGAIHQRDYGGEKTGGLEYGVFWYKLTETEITVYRNNNDENWEYVRVMIWKIPE